jgi:hypothetical protein
MLIAFAASGLAVWMLLALVTGLVLGAAMRRRDRCGVPVARRQPTFVSAADDAAAGAERAGVRR